MNQIELVNFLDNILEPKKYKDHTYNGLQFEGKEIIKNIASAVDISYNILQEASNLNIDFLITHHGLIWKGINKIESVNKQRLQLLFQDNINLYCSHLPLDIHPTLGNNACIINLLGLKNTFESYYEVGYFAEYSTSISYNEFKKLINQYISNNLIEMPFGTKNIKRIAICSGGSGLSLDSLFEAHQKGADTILTGETCSILYHYAKELQMNIITTGHYASEVFGVQAILTILKEKFGSEYNYYFINQPSGF